MRIDNTIRSQIQSTAESAASSSASAEEKTSTETSTSSQNTDSIETADPNSDSAIRSEVAAALGVPENDPAVTITIATTVAARQQQQANDAASVNANDGQQQVKEGVSVEAQTNEARNALTNGVREETKVKIGDNEGVMFKEIVPSASGDIADTVVRSGLEYIEHGFFGDKITRDTLYRDPTGHAIGRVTSIIEDGIERITKVTNYEPGAISLKVGDTRKVPDSQGGNKPLTWDPQPDGSYGTTTGASSSSSSSASSGSQSSSGPSGPSYGQDTGIDKGSASASNDSSSQPSGDGAASDPNEWAAWPGTSSDSGSSGLYATAVDARDDGSVLITTSDGESHEFSNFSDAAAYAKNLSAPPSSSGGSSGDGETHTSTEGNTTVEVEGPDSGEDGGGEEGGTKINQGEDDKYYAQDENSIGIDYGTPPAERGVGKEVSSSSSSTRSGYKLAESSQDIGNPNNVVRSIFYFDQGWKMDQFGGVTDGSRPDMEDNSAREAPYEGPGYGVIDPTPEGDDYTAAVRDPNDNLNFGGRGGDPVNPDNPIDNSRPNPQPPSTAPYSDNE
jgi:hypothetical protein